LRTVKEEEKLLIKSLERGSISFIKAEKPAILQRKTVSDRILRRIMLFVETFVNELNKVA
jgi:hypothetical protein